MILLHSFLVRLGIHCSQFDLSSSNGAENFEIFGWIMDSPVQIYMGAHRYFKGLDSP